MFRYLSSFFKKPTIDELIAQHLKYLKEELEKAKRDGVVFDADYRYKLPLTGYAELHLKERGETLSNIELWSQKYRFLTELQDMRSHAQIKGVLTGKQLTDLKNKKDEQGKREYGRALEGMFSTVKKIFLLVETESKQDVPLKMFPPRKEKN